MGSSLDQGQIGLEAYGPEEAHVLPALTGPACPQEHRLADDA